MKDRRSYGVLKQQLSIWIKGAFIGGILIVLFYNSILGFFVLLPYLPVYYKREREGERKKEQQVLRKEFEQIISLFTKGLELGYSLEHCVETATEEYERMVEEKDSFMLLYLRQFLKKMQMNIPIQQIFEQFAKESGLEEAESFAQIIDTARKTGGNLPAILRRTTEAMIEKEQVQEEIITMMSAKRMEQKVMTAMPIGILAYMRITSAGYMEPLYHNVIGVVVATVGLFLIAISIVWTEKIISIDI
ncbi:MAG: hypothetical protein IAC13_05340 [Firmicutes bacterium]|uniref:Type II secretion system protein GspF domain-containing protein n=1 Tax=Candidatus Scybalomonas excrementavium TaxID=2840943 RepID=A0A9D9N7R6_9FIRM|nr:hypothetical protein [Candidatus Scybalomonas excrementavium]